MNDKTFRQKQEEQNKGLSVRKWLCSTSIIVLVGVTPPGAVMAQEWTGGVSNDWVNPANWQGGSVPTGSTDVSINNEGAGWPIIGSGTHQSRMVTIGLTSGGGNLTITGGGVLNSNDRVSIGRNHGGSATVTGAGSRWNAPEFLLGVSSSGTLTISNNGRVNSDKGVLGFNSLGSGTVNVQGGGQWVNSQDITIGADGTGALNIASAGVVSAATTTVGSFGSGTGTITVDGANSLLTTGGFIVGRQAQGTVSATNGGALESESGIIGEQAGSTGTVDLRSGAFWHVDTAVTIGAAGTGSLLIDGGAKVESQIATVGRNLGGAGTVTVSGNGSNWTNTGDFTIARDGAGAMTVTGDGATVNSGRLLIGGIAGADGMLTLAHDGKWTSTQDAVIGAGGTGKLRIESGGWLTTIGGQVGTAAGSNGTVEINSAAASNKISTWDATTGDVTVGGAGGTGKITVTQGGNLEAQNLLLAASGGGSATVDVSARGTILTKNTLIGTNGGAGAFTVSGDQTLLRATSFLRVGHNGDGSLLVNDKGHVWADRLHIGNVGTGSVTVSNQALVTATVGLRVGDTSDGTLTVNSGGTVASDGAAIGLGPGSTGAVLVTGVGTQWNALGALGGGINVGDNGNASLTVTDQAVLRANAVNVGTLATSATLTASGGATVTSGNLTIGHGPGRKGTATITGAGTNWTANGGVFVGLQADGALTIADGARLQSADSSIGGLAGTSGNVLVTGTNSVWDLGAGVVSVGGVGTGTLAVENGGAVNGDVGVLSFGTLRGNGTVGHTSIYNGGTLVGVQGQTLTMASLALDSAANVNVSLGAPGNATGLFKVNGNLTLDGTLNVTNAGGFGQGVYRIIDYTGSLGDGGLIVGTMPSGTTGTVQTAVANQVNLLVSGMANDTQFWNGATTTADGVIHGGDGTWRLGPTNWTDANGTTAAAWGNGFAVFQNNPGTVTVDTSAGAITTTGMQFIGSGWRVQGGQVGLAGAGGETVIRVGDGTAAGAGWFATITSELTGASRLVKDDLGTLVLAGPNNYTGGTQINAGTLRLIGNGTLPGDVLNNAELVFNRSSAYSFGGAITGNGVNRQLGGGMLTLTGNSSAFGGSTVVGSSLTVNGQLGGSISVVSGATLAGSGTVGTVSIDSGGILAGAQGQTLTTGNLTLASGANVNVSLGMPGNATGLFNVGGNLTLDGTLNVSNAGGFGQGVYRVFDYTGSLTDNGMNVGTLPSGTGTVQTAVANQVNLLVSGMANDTQFWNGATTTADGVVHGGNGTWRTGPTNWTDANGATASAWAGQFAVFQNNPGVVTVDNSAGDISTTGMQFIGAGWNVSGDEIRLTGGGDLTTIRVGDGSAAGAGHSVTIASNLTSLGGLVKQDLGTLILTGENSYSGGTDIKAGTLRVGDGGTTGSITGDVRVGGVLAFNRSDAYAFSGPISGNGAIRQTGSGTTTLTGNGSTFTGTTQVESGTLAVNGQLGGSLAVLSGGRLTGTGTVGAVSVANGGILTGTQGQTLNTGNLTLASGANVNVSLGTPGNASGLFNVGGNLTLDGTLNVSDAGGFGQGVYRIFDYSGSLTDNGMNVGTMPSGTGTIQTAMANQVNLVVDNGGPIPTTQFWNGTTTTADGTIHGGNGTWTAGSATNWTNAAGSASAAWGGNFAVFQSNPGTVTVDNAAGAVSTTGMQFMGAGWNVTGAAITLNGAGGNTTVRVGDGTVASASDSATIGSVLTGNSRLVKDDYGTLILTGANSYSGGTTIAGGTLQIGDVGTSGSITGDVLNNGLLRFSRTDATTFGGLISGSGAVHVAYGQLTLTGNNSYAGETTIGSVASLTLGDGGTTGSVSGNIVNNGLLRFNRSNDLTYAGVISGYGAIRQIGSGKTELTGNSSAYTGSTTVENGILAVNGQLGGSLDVWAGGRLQGTGTVGNTIVSGVIAPGNSIGTLNVGNITFMGGSIYEVEVNAAGQTDLIKASGTATINGGSVQVLAGSGNYAPQTQYTILTATGGRTGNFAGVTSNLAFLDPSLSYDANNVYLTMTRNDILFQNVGITPNQIATGGGVESLGLGNAVYDAVLNLSAPQAQYAFDQLSGEIHASTKTAMLEDSRFIRNAVNDRIRAAFDGVGASSGTVVTYDNGKPQAVAANTDGGAVWGHAFGAWGHWNGDGNAARLDRSIGGFFVGADAPAFDTWRFGAVAGYSRTSFNVRDRHSSGTSDNYHVGLYGGTTWGDLAFRTGAAYTWHDISTNRSVIFPGFGNSLTGDYGASTTQVFGELGYKMQAGNVAFEPFANLAYVNLHTEGFTEKGGAAALTSGSSSTDATFTTLGLRAASSFNLGETVVTAKGMVGWRHAFGDVTPDSVMRFAGGGNAFTIGGVPIARNAAVVEAGLDFALSPTATLGVSYGGQFGSGVIDQSVRANFNVKF